MILVIVVVVVCQCCRLRRHRLIVESVAASLLLTIYAHNLTKCDEFVISHYVLFFSYYRSQFFLRQMFIPLCILTFRCCYHSNLTAL